MKTIDDTIATLETKIKQAKARKQRLEAQKRALGSKQQRADDTRRKILVGAAVLGKVERGEWPKDNFLDIMSQTLTHPQDRCLFGLDGNNDVEVSILSNDSPTPLSIESDYFTVLKTYYGLGLKMMSDYAESLVDRFKTKQTNS